MPSGVYKRTPEGLANVKAAAQNPERRKKISDKRLGMKFSDEHRKNIALARTGEVATEETKAKLRKIHQEINRTPEWRKKMSDQTKAQWSDTEKREKIKSAIIIGMGSKGHNFPEGIPQSQLDFAEILCSVGYIMHYSFHINHGFGKPYELDFAHIEAKTNIEIDGSSHKHRIEHDSKRDQFLKEFGWKVIRIKLWR